VHAEIFSRPRCAYDVSGIDLAPSPSSCSPVLDIKPFLDTEVQNEEIERRILLPVNDIVFGETGTDPCVIRDNANRDAKKRDSDYILGYLRVYVLVHARAMVCAFQLPTMSAVS